MFESHKKPKILIFTSNYLPGYKAGGILRTIANTVDWLGNYYDFWIVTRDRDIGDTKPYSGINVNEWQHVNGATVYYMSPELITIKNIVKLIHKTSHNVIHLNSFFDSVFTIRILIAKRIGLLTCNQLILSPRGEFVDGPLKLKYIKKIIYIKISKILGFYNKIIWHVSNFHELLGCAEIMKINSIDFKIAIDLPSKVSVEVPNNKLLDNGKLRIVFLSRLTREKNIDYALRILKKIKVDIIFDIYGPDEDAEYWGECQLLIKQLPQNVVATYYGSVSPVDVPKIFSCYDLFFFPSRGENYGHVIAEALSVGTKVLISKNTPWLELESDSLGWDVDLSDESLFIKLIEELALLDSNKRAKSRTLVKQMALVRLITPKMLNDNIELYKNFH